MLTCYGSVGIEVFPLTRGFDGFCHLVVVARMPRALLVVVGGGEVEERGLVAELFIAQVVAHRNDASGGIMHDAC